MLVFVENINKGNKAKQGSSFLPYIIKTEMKIDAKNIITNSIILPLQRNGKSDIRGMDVSSKNNTQASNSSDNILSNENQARETQQSIAHKSLGFQSEVPPLSDSAVANKFGAEFDYKKLKNLDTVLNKVMDKAQELLEKKSKLWFPASLESKFNFDYKRQVIEFESQNMIFSAKGVLESQEGSEVSFQIGFALSREFYSEVAAMGGYLNNGDSLAISFREKSSQLTDVIFSFDISKTQPEESVGSGFLIINRSEDIQLGQNVKNSSNQRNGYGYSPAKSEAYSKVERKAEELLNSIQSKLDSDKSQIIDTIKESFDSYSHIDKTI